MRHAPFYRDFNRSQTLEELPLKATSQNVTTLEFQIHSLMLEILYYNIKKKIGEIYNECNEK